MSHSKKILGILSLAIILSSAHVHGMEKGAQDSDSYRKIGLCYYKKLENGTLQRLPAQELASYGISIDNDPICYGAHVAADNPYKTGNAVIGAGGSVATVIGHKNNWFNWKKGALGTLGSMALYSGFVRVYQWFHSNDDNISTHETRTVDEKKTEQKEVADIIALRESMNNVGVFYSEIMIDATNIAKGGEMCWQKEVEQQVKSYNREDLKDLVTALYKSTPGNVQENFDAISDALGKKRIELVISQSLAKPLPTPPRKNDSSKPPTKPLPVPTTTKKKSTSISFGNKSSMVSGFLEEDAKRIARGEKTINKADVEKEIKQCNEGVVPGDLQTKVDAFYKSGRGNLQRNLNVLTDAFGMERIEEAVSQESSRGPSMGAFSMGGISGGDLTNSKLFQRQVAQNQ